MDEIGINVLVEAKLEYTKQLISLLSPRIYDLLKEIYSFNCNNDKKYELKNFQLALSKIPSWDQFKVEELTSKILEKVKCEWIDELLTAVFVSNTRILTAVQMKKSNKKIKLEVPKLSIFVHKCFIECARELYKNPYLMLYDDKPEIIHQNMRETFNIIKDSINETIRKLLPFKEILKKYLGSSNDTFDDTTSIISEPSVSKPSNKIMRKLLGDEIDEESIYSFTENEKNLEEDFPEENETVKSSTDTIVNNEFGEDIHEEQYETETLKDFKFSNENIKEDIINVSEKQKKIEDNLLTQTDEEISEEKTIILKPENKVELTHKNIENLGLNIEENKESKIIENLESETANRIENDELTIKTETQKSEINGLTIQNKLELENEKELETKTELDIETNKLTTQIEEEIKNKDLIFEPNEAETFANEIIHEETESEVEEAETEDLKSKNGDLFEIDTFINKNKNKNSKDSIIIPIRRKIIKRKKINYKNKFLTPDRLKVSNDNIKKESSFEDELNKNILFSDLQDEKENEL